MKEDRWPGGNFLKGRLGDLLNALLCGVGQDSQTPEKFWLQFVLAGLK